MVIAGRQSFSSSSNDKHTVPLYTIGQIFASFSRLQMHLRDKYLDEIVVVRIYIWVVLMDNHL